MKLSETLTAIRRFFYLTKAEWEVELRKFNEEFRVIQKNADAFSKALKARSEQQSKLLALIEDEGLERKIDERIARHVSEYHQPQERTE
jgi:aminoglycoside phosphotransferase family enzyme